VNYVHSKTSYKKSFDLRPPIHGLLQSAKKILLLLEFLNRIQMGFKSFSERGFAEREAS